MTELERLVAIEDIRQLKARYWLAVDTLDEAALRATFAPDAVIPAHGDVAETRTAEDFVTHLLHVMQGARSLHLGGQGIVMIHSAVQASAIWPVEDRIWAPEQGSRLRFRRLHGWGHYHDDYRRTDAGWRIQSFRLDRIRLDID